MKLYAVIVDEKLSPMRICRSKEGANTLIRRCKRLGYGKTFRIVEFEEVK